MNPKRRYHHGDLKRALLDAALELVRTKGAEAFTLREVARRAGVSHNAPYRHFRDRGELLAAVAVEAEPICCGTAMTPGGGDPATGASAPGGGMMPGPPMTGRLCGTRCGRPPGGRGPG